MHSLRSINEISSLLKRFTRRKLLNKNPLILFVSKKKI